jgi:hypothetical protein
MNQPENQADPGSALRHQDSPALESEEPDWWAAEVELKRKQFRGRTFQGTYGEEPERPRKRGKAQNRRGSNDHSERT